MAVDVIMPRLSDSMEEGTVLRWLKSVGDEVKRGDELVEIETDKANMTYEATDEGTLVEIVAQEGDTLPIGEIIARIGEKNGPSAAGAAAGAKKQPSAATAADGSPEGATARKDAEPEPAPEPEPEPAAPARAAERPAEPSADGRVKASPIARRMARELGIELSDLAGSGPGGRIVKADVVAAAGGVDKAEPAVPTEERRAAAAAPAPARAATEAPETAKGQVQVVELSRMQRTIARRMAESKATVPHFYLQMEIDMSEAVKMRAQLKQVVAEGSPVPTFNDMVVKSCALALREFPRANGSYRDGHVELHSRINVGIAVAAQDALVVPTVFDADRRTLGEIGSESRELATKVRDGSITPPELSGGTFTVSNLGMFGVENFAAVINPPQAALLAVGAVEKKAIVDDAGEIVAQERMGVTLACDHRILYGADGAQFLARVRDLLEHPLAMAL